MGIKFTRGIKFYDVIQSFSTDIIRLLLYNDIISIDELIIDEINGYEMKNIIKSKCCFVTKYLSYILDFKNEKFIYHNCRPDEFNIPNFNTKNVYWIKFQGMSKLYSDHCMISEYTNTSTNHEIILLPIENEWYIFDSYNNQRKIERRKVDLNYLIKFINNNRLHFNVAEWNKFFNISIIPDNTVCVTTYIRKYDWNQQIVCKKIKDLVKITKLRLESDPSRISRLYLRLLNEDLDGHKANKFLQQICRKL